MEVSEVDFDEYARRANETDKNPLAPNPEATDRAYAIPLYGLAGEAGTVLSLYKKYLRDGAAYAAYSHQLCEELGDVLWYVANIASKSDLSLSDIARRNLEKVEGRWLPQEAERQIFFDVNRPTNERLPRWFEATFSEARIEGRDCITVRRDGEQIGNQLTDNSRMDDGYRFHDAFHFAYACKLGWSPVTRKLLGCKRGTDLILDNVEDGGRAIAYEEAVSGLVFENARDHGFYAQVKAVDFGVLDTIKLLVRKMEVSSRSMHDWEDAILSGFEIWRQIREHRGGVVQYDLEQRKMTFANA